MNGTPELTAIEVLLNPAEAMGKSNRR